MRYTLAAVAAALALAPAAHAGQVKAGAAAVDASWHVGASAGQYASDGTPVGMHDNDPHLHSTKRAPSYGIQSRLEARALVVEGPDGKRLALVKNDLYIPQDLLYRRTAQLLEQGDSGIGRANLTMAVTHDHSSPFYSSTSWGAWAFQDVFDIRFFNYYAQQMAQAVENAAADLKPVRVGASVSQFDKTHRHSFGPAVADDGTPAGYPNSETDHDMTVVRFDDISDPRHPKPLANLVNFSLHPEMLNGNDLISADYIAPLQRMVDRQTGALTIWTQNAVGTSEPERSSFHSMHERLEFTHREYAQSEFAARLMADSIVDTWRDIDRRTPEDAARFVPFKSDFAVSMEDRWFPGPLSHPYPGVSNCRTDKAFQGNPQVPVVGLPDCGGPTTLADMAGLDSPVQPSDLPFDPGVSTDTLQAAGIPVPENYSAPGYTGLEEDVSVHLQAFRLGDILFTVCSCEQWFDQSTNIETRTDRVEGNEWLGYDWSTRCTDDGDTWSCPDPRDPAKNLPPIPEAKVLRMRAQVNNDAKGWNSVENLPWAESEPTNPEEIKGNYTHDELPPELGYKLTVPIGMGNDYNGYIATYREYQRGDHYRKALTAWGPHSSDYMASRLVALGGILNGGDEGELMPEDHGQEKVPADLALNDARAQALGELGTSGVSAYEATLPDDAGPVVATQQPKDVERFAAAFFSWTGGSNYTDNPVVRVQRLSGGRWSDFADQSGEIPVTLKYPEPGGAWEWTAHFEAFAAPFDTGSGQATQPGTYRFLVQGRRRTGGEAEPYEIASEEFAVKQWSGITVDDLRVEPDGRVSFAVGPRHTVDAFDMDNESAPPLKVSLGPIDYPDSYESPARFIANRKLFKRDPAARDDASRFELYCLTCSFRPWKDTGDAVASQVTVVRRGRTFRLRAVRVGDRWRTTSALDKGDSAYVAAGDVRDGFGNFNGTNSGRVTR